MLFVIFNFNIILSSNKMMHNIRNEYLLLKFKYKNY